MAGNFRNRMVFGRGGVLGGGGYGGGGGGDPFGAIGGFINSMGWNPELEQAKQLQQAKMQEIQTRTQIQQAVQQQAEEAMAGYRRLGEQIVPEAGTEVPTEAEGPGAGQVLGTFAGAPTQNDLLLKAMIQSGNPSLLAKAQAQFAPQEPQPSGPPSVYDIGGGHRVIQQPNGQYAFVPKESKDPVDKSFNTNDLITYATTGIKGPTIPANMTQQNAKAIVAAMPAQERVVISQQQMANRPSRNGTYVNRQTGEVENPSTEEEGRQHIFLPHGGASEKVKTGSDLFDTHINGALDMYEATPDANRGGRVSSYLKNSWKVFANDPAKVALFQFYGAATPFATSSVYNSMTGGRGSALMAQMLDPTGIEKGDNDATGLNKLYVGESLAREAAIKRGIPTAPYDKTINRIQSIARRRNVPLLQQFGTGGTSQAPPPPAGFR